MGKVTPPQMSVKVVIRQPNMITPQARPGKVVWVSLVSAMALHDRKFGEILGCIHGTLPEKYCRKSAPAPMENKAERGSQASKGDADDEEPQVSALFDVDRMEDPTPPAPAAPNKDKDKGKHRGKRARG